MANSIYTGQSGLIAFQTQIDVLGNNLANSNTTGFKSQQTNFEDLFYQTLQAATTGSGSSGGTNPSQLGLGVNVASLSGVFTQGTLTPTGRNLDLAIQGNGFFAVANGSSTFYTRDGALSLNVNQQLVQSATGFAVQRFGTVGQGGNGQPAFQTAGNNNIVIPFGTTVPGQATSSLTLQGNLNASAAVGSTTTPTTIQIFDSQGATHTLTLQFTKTGANTWSLTGSLPTTDGVVSPNTISGITFDNTGTLTSPATGTMAFTITSPAALPAQTITFNLGTPGQTNGLTQFGGTSTAAGTSQNGFASGTLNTVAIGPDGTITGTFSNNQQFPIAQIGLATFINTGGLNRVGNNLFSVSAQSGPANFVAPTTGGAGTINQGSLENSNVDQTGDLVNLVVAQRNYDANADTVTVSNQILQTTAGLIVPQ